MKMILNWNSWSIYEGAKLEKDQEVQLDWENSEEDQDEVLKTVGGEGSFEILGNNDAPGYEVSLGLDYSTYSRKVDHPGRFKKTMDQLKKGKILGSKEAVRKFLERSYREHRIDRVDWVVSTETTGELNQMMLDATLEIFPEAKKIILNKLEFDNPGLAIDWDEVQSQVDRQGIKTLHRLMSEITGWLDRDPKFPTFNPNKMKKLIQKLGTVDEIREFFYDSIRMLKWKETHRDGRPLIPFKMRSSGFLSRDGLRHFFYPKYDLDANDYSNAVIDCIVDGKKRMLFLDDNVNTAIDLTSIAKKIDRSASDLGFTDFGYRRAFKFYVMYSMSDRKITDPDFVYKIDGETSIFSSIGKSEEYVKKFDEFLEGKEGSIGTSSLRASSARERKYLEQQRIEYSRSQIEKKRSQNSSDSKKKEILNKIGSMYGSSLTDLIIQELGTYADQDERKNKLQLTLSKISRDLNVPLPYLVSLYYGELKASNLQMDKSAWPFDIVPRDLT